MRLLCHYRMPKASPILNRDMFIRLKTKEDGTILDVDIQRCAWYEIDENGVITVLLTEEQGEARGVLSDIFSGRT